MFEGTKASNQPTTFLSPPKGSRSTSYGWICPFVNSRWVASCGCCVVGGGVGSSNDLDLDHAVEVSQRHLASRT